MEFFGSIDFQASSLDVGCSLEKSKAIYTLVHRFSVHSEE